MLARATINLFWSLVLGHLVQRKKCDNIFSFFWWTYNIERSMMKGRHGRGQEKLCYYWWIVNPSWLQRGQAPRVAGLRKHWIFSSKGAAEYSHGCKPVVNFRIEWTLKGWQMGTVETMSPSSSLFVIRRTKDLKKLYLLNQLLTFLVIWSLVHGHFW